MARTRSQTSKPKAKISLPECSVVLPVLPERYIKMCLAGETKKVHFSNSLKFIDSTPPSTSRSVRGQKTRARQTVNDKAPVSSETQIEHDLEHRRSEYRRSEYRRSEYRRSDRRRSQSSRRRSSTDSERKYRRSRSRRYRRRSPIRKRHHRSYRHRHHRYYSPTSSSSYDSSPYDSDISTESSYERPSRKRSRSQVRARSASVNRNSVKTPAKRRARDASPDRVSTITPIQPRARNASVNRNSVKTPAKRRARDASPDLESTITPVQPRARNASANKNVAHTPVCAYDRNDDINSTSTQAEYRALKRLFLAEETSKATPAKRGRRAKSISGRKPNTTTIFRFLLFLFLFYSLQ